MEQSRRDFLKRSAVAGGIVWAAPVISSLPAHAQTTAGTPCPTVCSGGARALFLDPPVLDQGFTFGEDNDPADTNPGGFDVCELDPSAIIARAELICGDFDGTTCTSRAQVVGVQSTPVFPVDVTFDVLTSEASLGPDGCPTGTSSLTSLVIEGQSIADGTATPNSTVNVSIADSTVTVVLNEQVCEDGVFIVRALHITVIDNNTITGKSELIIAESRAGNACCPACA